MTEEEILIDKIKRAAEVCYSAAEKAARQNGSDGFTSLDSGLHNLIEYNKHLENLGSEAKSKLEKETGPKIESAKKYLFQACFNSIDQNVNDIEKVASRESKNKTGNGEQYIKNKLHNIETAKGYLNELGQKYKEIVQYSNLETRIKIAKNTFEHTYGSKKKS